MRNILLILIILLFSNGSLSSPIKTIKLAYSDIESFPFQMGNGTSVARPPGLSIDVIEQAARQLHIKIEYVRLPGKRVLHHIRANDVDGGFIFSYNQERAKYADYPLKENQADSALRIATLDYFLYKLKQQPVNWDGTRLEAVNQMLVGAHRGFSIVKILQANKIATLEVETTEKLFEMLRKRRLAAVAIQSNIATSFIEENQLTNIERIEPPISTKDYYLIFSHRFTEQNPELVEQIWQTIGEVRDQVIESNTKKYLAQEKAVN